MGNTLNAVKNIPTVNMEATGNRIRALRIAAGLTVRDVQEILGFGTPQAIYKWQHGACLPTVDNLIILSAIFHTTIDSILILNESQDVPVCVALLYLYRKISSLFIFFLL